MKLSALTRPTPAARQSLLAAMREGDGHQAPRRGMGLCLSLYGFVQNICRLAQSGMGGDEAICDRAQDRISLACLGELIAESLALMALADACHADAERFQDTAHAPFEVFAQPDHSRAGSDQATQPVGRFAADMDWRAPAGACELCQAFGIGGVRFFEARRRGFVCLTRIDACGAQLQTHQPALSPH